MKKSFKVFTILSTLLIIGLFISKNSKQIVAEESLCPSSMDPDSRECLDYLRDQLTDINKTNSDIENKL